ncbi:MAG TPA: hypothetical protein VGJ82_09990 [Thermoanaerobaculia bacterium]
MATFPFFEVLNYETGLPVKVVVWHVRSVRPIREMADDNETLTRIEYANGDCLDTSDTVGPVLCTMHASLDPVIERLVTACR